MPTLLKLNGVVDDNWRLVGIDDGDELPTGTLLVPVQKWLAHRQQWRARGDIGVWMDGDQDLDEIAQDIPSFDVIAIRFPDFVDGRGFSLASVLRERLGFTGELRAIGKILREQLFYLKRCGFDSFQLPDGDDPEAARACLYEFTTCYQAACAPA
jgi:uncharacterized protein (DUF934 family)